MTGTSVFVSGATGFIAQHIVKELVSKGYKVIGSVRSTEKGDRLKKNVGDAFSYEIVPDIQVEGAFNEALKRHPEISVVLHTASPFHFKSTDPENDLLKPAVEGTRNALKAVQQFAPQVKKVVITSSYAAIAPSADEADDTKTISEATWNTITWDEALQNPVNGYRGSKTFAERAAWDFVKAEKPHFSITTVNPSFVFGPQGFKSEVKDELNTSAEIINALLQLKPDDKVPFSRGGFIDVRDVAKAHLAAFEKDAAEGKRLLLSNERFVTQNVLNILNDKFKKELGGKIPVGEPAKGYQDYKFATIDNKATRDLLGFEFISLEQSVVDSVQQLLDVKGNL